MAGMLGAAWDLPAIAPFPHGVINSISLGTYLPVLHRRTCSCWTFLLSLAITYLARARSRLGGLGDLPTGETLAVCRCARALRRRWRAHGAGSAAPADRIAAAVTLQHGSLGDCPRG